MTEQDTPEPDATESFPPAEDDTEGHKHMAGSPMTDEPDPNAVTEDDTEGHSYKGF
jgi:hypothetical protein